MTTGAMLVPLLAHAADPGVLAPSKCLEALQWTKESTYTKIDRLFQDYASEQFCSLDFNTYDSQFGATFPVYGVPVKMDHNAYVSQKAERCGWFESARWDEYHKVFQYQRQGDVGRKLVEGCLQSSSPLNCYITAQTDDGASYRVRAHWRDSAHLQPAVVQKVYVGDSAKPLGTRFKDDGTYPVSKKQRKSIPHDGSWNFVLSREADDKWSEPVTVTIEVKAGNAQHDCFVTHPAALIPRIARHRRSPKGSGKAKAPRNLLYPITPDEPKQTLMADLRGTPGTSTPVWGAITLIGCTKQQEVADIPIVYSKERQELAEEEGKELPENKKLPDGCSTVIQKQSWQTGIVEPIDELQLEEALEHGQSYYLRFEFGRGHGNNHIHSSFEYWLVNENKHHTPSNADGQDDQDDQDDQ